MERAALGSLAAALRTLGIRWALMGALGASRAPPPGSRRTWTCSWRTWARGRRRSRGALRAEGWTVRRASAEGELLRLRHPELGTADLLIAGTDYQQEAIARAREELLSSGERIPILSPEDVILHKLIAARTQDLADVEAILAAKIPLDEAYLERWADFWDVLGRWRALRARTSPR